MPSVSSSPSSQVKASNVNTRREQRPRARQQPSKSTRNLRERTAPTSTSDSRRLESNLQAVRQQRSIAVVEVRLDQRRHLVAQRMVLASRAPNLTRTILRHGVAGATARRFAVVGPVRQTLLPGRAVAGVEDVVLVVAADLLQSGPDGLHQSFSAVVQAEAGDAAPLAVDGDFGVEVCVVGPGVAATVVGWGGDVGEHRLRVSVGGVDFLPGLGEEVEVADVDHRVAVADFCLDFGRGDGQEASGGEELGDVVLHCDLSVEGCNVRLCFIHVERVGTCWEKKVHTSCRTGCCGLTSGFEC